MKSKLLAVVASLGMVFFMACQKEEVQIVNDEAVSGEVQAKIHQLGFSTQNAKRLPEGYLVEGDILLSEQDLNRVPDRQLLRVGAEEQYHTTNRVKGLPRVITVSISSRFPSEYVAALDTAIARYNAEKLQITFRRVNGSADIAIVRGNGSYLASAGFPTETGDPHNQIKLNANAVGDTPNRSYLATILAHEIGHCIGFRHTDYMDRSYSCGGQTANEGASTVGAVHIPGTATGADPNSWMLACIGSGQSRPFNSNDKTALSYLY